MQKIIKGITAKSIIALMLLIGIVSLCMGIVIQNNSVILDKKPKNIDAVDWQEDKEIKEKRNYMIGAVVWNIGIAWILLALLLGGIFENEIDIKIRILMLILVIVIVIISSVFDFNIGFNKWSYKND